MNVLTCRRIRTPLSKTPAFGHLAYECICFTKTKESRTVVVDGSGDNGAREELYTLMSKSQHSSKGPTSTNKKLNLGAVITEVPKIFDKDADAS